MDVDDEEDGDCSDGFYLLASSEAPSVGDADGPYLMVTSPSEGDSAEAGEEYTVEVSFDLACCVLLRMYTYPIWLACLHSRTWRAVGFGRRHCCSRSGHLERKKVVR